MNSVLACFNWRTIVTPEDGDEEEKEVVEPLKAVYRDELTIKKAPPVPCKAPKKSVRFAEEGEGEGEGEGIRVKVKMTKEEANRLLSKCKEGGLLDFKDVARELVNIPIHRVTVLSIPQQQ